MLFSVQSVQYRHAVTAAVVRRSMSGKLVVGIVKWPIIV